MIFFKHNIVFESAPNSLFLFENFKAGRLTNFFEQSLKTTSNLISLKSILLGGVYVTELKTLFWNFIFDCFFFNSFGLLPRTSTENGSLHIFFSIFVNNCLRIHFYMHFTIFFLKWDTPCIILMSSINQCKIIDFISLLNNAVNKLKYIPFF
ncbi:hypothetical protein D8887_10770 [Streptococcus sanguinis]|uniref:Uncharacterized protein n=1 Tax=Streptococcus sanguinis TaxID=1305 RepID=A0A3R9G3H0_STRSA|nr:hypothetical protein D8887_10770 [Streptococcus sanguinis]